MATQNARGGVDELVGEIYRRSRWALSIYPASLEISQLYNITLLDMVRTLHGGWNHLRNHDLVSNRLSLYRRPANDSISLISRSHSLAFGFCCRAVKRDE